MKLAFYYTLTNNSKYIVDHLNNIDEIREIKIKRKLPKSFFFRVFIGGFLAGINKKEKLVNVNLSIDEFDEIIIVSPIWNGKFCPALNGLLKRISLQNKKVTFIFTSGSGTGEKALKKINKEYSNAEVLFLKEPLIFNDEIMKLEELNND